MSDSEKVTLLRNALIGLVGESDRKELEQLEAALRILPAPDHDKIAMINAIRAIINTEEPVTGENREERTTRQMYEKAIEEMVYQDLPEVFMLRDGIVWDGDRPLQKIEIFNPQAGNAVVARWILSSDEVKEVVTNGMSADLFDNVRARVETKRQNAEVVKL